MSDCADRCKTLTAEGRTLGLDIGITPDPPAGLHDLRPAPTYIVPMFTQPIGWVILIAGLVVYIIGIVWMRNLVKMEV